MAQKPHPSAPPARSRQIILERQPDESLAAWESTLVAIAQGGAATVTRQPDGSALICWPAGVAL
ncbi:DUF1654 domain-containing protein [Billgrantia bachuensis]|uniref:DUF1654 domain-containing protein n=1 Tax=Billgrantia bachuensis TaxID=2717286 RepID=A0ABX0PQ19_9GAMM|nr:DUF1654 domain-containing protein [Halomonas bachuensis]